MTVLGALGHQGYLAAVKEATWGTDPGAGYTSQKITAESLKTKVSYLFGKPIANNRQVTSQKVPGAIDAGGSISWDADVEGLLGLALKGILSAEVYASDTGVGTFTVNGSPSAGTFTVDINGTAVSYVYSAGGTADIANGLKLAINALPAFTGILTAGVVSSVVTVTATATGLPIVITSDTTNTAGWVYTTNGLGIEGSHTFTPSQLTLPSFAFLVSRDSAVDTNVWSFPGSTFDALALSAAEGQVLKAQATITSKNGTSGATGITPSYTTEMPLVFHSGTFKVGGVAVPLKSWKCDIKGGNFSKRGMLGSRFIQQQMPGPLEVSGEVEAYFTDQSLVNDYLNGTDAVVEAKFTGSALGADTRSLDILVPVAQFTGETPSVANATSEIMLKLPFTAWLSGSGSPNDLIQAVLINSKQAAY